ncbi:MAG TPA: DinB family protein [Gemmatimonadaceae bacterium]|nr:DinB family protein [Gemmatimonadaceae bacterium]
MSEYAVELREAVERAATNLHQMSDEDSRRQPKPGKWCPREVIGHLIDSASNNHQRFVRAQFKDDLLFDGYEQDAWVSLQKYRDAPWDELIDLWRNFNLHIARIMQSAPYDERVRKRALHNLDEIAWRPVPRDEPVTLDYFMSDYVGHLKHHLAQIRPIAD